MTMQAKTSPQFDIQQMPVQLKLAAAWTSFMFLYLYVDHLVLYRPGHLENILSGMMWEFEVSQALVTAAFISLAIPALMILLSLTLPARVARLLNLAFGTLYIPYSIFNATGESWLYFFGLSIGMEVLILAFILRSAWAWPRLSEPTASGSAKAVRPEQQVHA